MGLLNQRITLAELADAVTAADAQLLEGCKTLRTLHALAGSLEDGSPDGLAPQFPDGPLPVTCAELDEALGELSSEELDIPAKALRTLKRARALLAEAEAARIPPESTDQTYVTHAELFALEQDLAARDKALAIVLENAELARGRANYVDGKLGYRLSQILAAPDEYAITGPVHAALKRFVTLMDATADREVEVTRRRARAPTAPGPGGYNF